ncbi:MAG: GNAT family N-acetyltransferase [Solirubrobacteraceae bacterium]|nr:GNAT family N-acetyltransferase [Solirubrobacteraceae bacterium]
MGWTTTEHAQEFLDAAGPLLRADAASNTMLLTAAASVAADGPEVFGDEPPLFGWWAGVLGRIDGAFIHSPPHPAQLSALPNAAVDPLAELLADRERPLTGVGAAGHVAEAFATAWCARRDVIAEIALRLRLYRLAALHEPDPAPPGRAAVATAADGVLVRAWIEAVGLETGAVIGASRTLDERLAAGALTIWRDPSDTPVALAGYSREVDGTRRINAVYTVAPHRRRGYGAAVTAVTCRRALDSGTSRLLLYADVDNPTSNALYRRLGFEPVEDRTVLRFEPHAGVAATARGER